MISTIPDWILVLPFTFILWYFAIKYGIRFIRWYTGYIEERQRHALRDLRDVWNEEQ